MNGLDYHFDQMLDAYLEEYFEDRENQWEEVDEDDEVVSTPDKLRNEDYEADEDYEEEEE